MNITLDDGRTELWQWDTGRKIVVDDKSVSEVHYSKYSSTQAITREVINGKAEIPNFLLQDTHAVTAYAYSGSMENGYTMAEKTFNVVKKPKPANYVETEEDKAILAKLKEAIGDLSELQTEAKDNLVDAINEVSASGGADWSQNDPSAKDYIKNRPGGYDVIETQKVFDMKLVSINDENMLTADADGSFAEGTPVHVSIDGAPEVICTIAVTVSGEIPVYSFGSKSYDEVVAGGLGATDYIVIWYEGHGKRAYQGIAGSDLVGKTIVARADVATPVKIPDKYLDLNSAKEIVLFTIRYNQSSEEYESDRTYDELKAALDAGKTVFAKFINVMGEFYTYGLLYQCHMYVPGIWVYTGGSDPCEWQCSEGNKWTKRQLLRLGTGYTMPKKAGTAAYGTSEYASRDDHVHQSELPAVSADDDGKLLGVTGGAWGKVDMPSGGTDMGITGAAVGQIAKITAVDTSGTPTAWEPADMPSGGGAITYDIAATAEHGGTNQALQGFACSVSSKQLRKAIDAGKTPRLVITIGTLNPLKMYMPMTYYFPVGTEYAYACFGCIGEGFPGAYLYYVICEGESESESGRPNWLARSFEATPATS